MKLFSEFTNKNTTQKWDPFESSFAGSILGSEAFVDKAKEQMKSKPHDLSVSGSVEFLKPNDLNGFKKKLKKLDDFEFLGINVKEATATLTAAPSKAVDYQSLREAVEKAGFTPREIQVEGSARLEEDEKESILVSEDGAKLFLLENNDVLAALDSARPMAIRFTGKVVVQEKRQAAHRLPLLVLTEASRVKESNEE